MAGARLDFNCTVRGGTVSIQVSTASSVRQYLLCPERQLGVFGGVEPILEPVSVPEQNVETPNVSRYQEELFANCKQIELPLRPNVIHKGHEECFKGYFSAICPNHQGEYKIKALTCGNIQCDASVDAVTNRRSKRQWDGRADKEKFGLRDFGEIPFGYFVVTFPKEYQHLLASKEGIRKFNKISIDLASWVIQNNGVKKGSKLYLIQQPHACGDESPDEFFYHSNVIVPLIGITSEGKISYSRHYLSKSLLDKSREWLKDRFKKAFNVEFLPVFHYSVAIDEAKKRHLVKYVFRNLLWNKVDEFRIRGSHGGLCNNKNRELLKQVLDRIGNSLPKWNVCRFSTSQNPCPEKMFFTAKTALQLSALIKTGSVPVILTVTTRRAAAPRLKFVPKTAYGGLEAPD